MRMTDSTSTKPELETLVERRGGVMIVDVCTGQNSAHTDMFDGKTQNTGYLSEMTGVDVTKGIPDEVLADFVQPLTVGASLDARQTATEHGLSEADATTGHSLGEYTALRLGKAFPGDTATLWLARRREVITADVLQSLDFATAMGAIMLGRYSLPEKSTLRSEIESWLKEYNDRSQLPGVLEFANDNSPGQSVITGSLERMKEFYGELPRGLKTRILEGVAGSFHCSVLEPAVARLVEEAECVGLESPKIPHFSPTIEGAKVTNVSQIVGKNGIVGRQLHTPVEWLKTVMEVVRTAQQAGVNHLVLNEVGPNPMPDPRVGVLAGFMAEIIFGDRKHNTGNYGDMKVSLLRTSSLETVQHPYTQELIKEINT